jgi:antitoxin component YwqK of YwqJK toxin-antitoxin module
MKPFLIIIVSFSFVLTAFGQDYLDSGFTNKAESKNLLVNGLKEGKWMVYKDSDSKTTNDTNAPSYCLTVYRLGKPIGIERTYYRSGKLLVETAYVNGEKNGIEKGYYASGEIFIETPYSDGKVNGLYKVFNENGTLFMETQFTNDKKNGIGKEYYENGKIKNTTIYKNDKAGAIKSYDENGNEIK